MDILPLVNVSNRSDYQKSNFESFLNAIDFSFSIPSIHISGTNGKGSTASYIYSILKYKGLKVGLYTSPYLFSVNETIVVNDVHISDDDIISTVNTYKKMIEKYDLSLFEIQTFVAFEYFKKCECDICVIECGLGGAFDATNVFVPILSVITSISLEHTDKLGVSISEIASHKGGIIKDYVPVVIGELNQEATKVIASIAKEHKSKLIKVSEIADSTILEHGYKFNYGIFKDLEINSNAYYSVLDAAIAVESIISIKEQYGISNDDIKNGLKNIYIPSRFDVLSVDPIFIVDGGHNPEAIDKLCESVSKKYIGKTIHVIYAAFKDKNITSILPKLSLLGSDVSITTFDHPRARVKEDYFIYLDDYEFYEDYIQLIKEKLLLKDDSVILVTGSLAFAMKVREDYKNGIFKI